MKGYIKDFRKELESDIWMMPPLYHRVWQYLKYKVNHAPNTIPMKDGTFFDIKPGQHLTSIRGVAKGVGYFEGLQWKEPNPKTISTILNWLEKQGMVTLERGKGNRQYTLITLLNWGSYQFENGEGNSRETADGVGSKQQADINKNEKEWSKNEKELCSSSESGFAEVLAFYQSNLQRGVTESQFNIELIGQWYEENGSDLLIAAMKVAAKAEAKGVNMVEGVLKNWKEAGVKNLEDARRYETEFKESKKRVQFKNNVTPIKPKKQQQYDYGF